MCPNAGTIRQRPVLAVTTHMGRMQALGIETLFKGVQAPCLRKTNYSNNLLKVYRALHLSAINCTALAWQPWLAATRLDQLERCKNRVLRIITGKLKTTLLEALRIEAGVPSIATQAQQQAAVSYEKTHRLPANHPCRTLLEEPCRHRLKRPSWRSTAKALTRR